MVRTYAIAQFDGVSPRGRRRELDLDQLQDLVLDRQVVRVKEHAAGFSPTGYRREYVAPPTDKRLEPIHVTAPALYRCNEGVERLSLLVVDVDAAEPDRRHLADLGYLTLGYTTFSHEARSPHWRLILPLARDVDAASWPRFYPAAARHVSPSWDTSVGDVSRFFFTHSTRLEHQAEAETFVLGGRLLDPSDIVQSPEPNSTPETRLVDRPKRPPTPTECIRAARLLQACAWRLGQKRYPGRQSYAYGLAHLLGHWVAAYALTEQAVEAALWTAATTNGAADERPGELERAIERGLAKGAKKAIDLDAKERALAAASYPAETRTPSEPAFPAETRVVP
jgi:hypothetical protein